MLGFEEWWEKTGRFDIIAPCNRIDAKRIWEAASLIELERCAKVCESQKYMVLNPGRTYSGEEVCQAQKRVAKSLAMAIRRGEG